MAEKKKSTRKTVDKWKKKKWFAVIASKTFNKKTLAQCPGEKPKNVIGRTMKVTLDTLTGQRLMRNISVVFKVHEVQGQNANTKILRFEVNKSSIGRMIRRRSSKVSVVEKVPVKGGDARITIVAITAKKATKKQRTGIRKIISKELGKLKGKEFEEVVKELLFGKFSNVVFKKAKKICLMKKVIPAKTAFTEAK